MRGKREREREGEREGRETWSAYEKENLDSSLWNVKMKEIKKIKVK